MKAGRFRLRIEHVLLLGGFLMLARWGSTAAGSWAYQSGAARVLAQRLADTARGRSPDTRAERTRTEARASGVVGRIRIPRVGVSAMVAEGIDPRTLDRAVGHVPGTDFPGERGNVALAGHRDAFFAGLAKIRAGDVVRIETPDGGFRYRVVDISVVGPRRVDLLEDTGGATLTLVTCYPFNVLGRAPLRFVVRAELLEEGLRAEEDAAGPRRRASRT